MGPGCLPVTSSLRHCQAFEPLTSTTSGRLAKESKEHITINEYWNIGPIRLVDREFTYTRKLAKMTDLERIYWRILIWNFISLQYSCVGLTFFDSVTFRTCLPKRFIFWLPESQIHARIA